MQALPLSFLAPGNDVVVTDVRARHGMLNHLAAMGIFPGTRLSVVCADRGSLIVAVGDTRYALSHGMAMKILVGEPAIAGPGTADAGPGPLSGCGQGCHGRRGCCRGSWEERP